MSRRQPRRPGRPTVLTADVETRLVDAISGGTPLNHAAPFAGISSTTLYAWLARGETEAARVADGDRPAPDEAIYRRLYERVTRARASVAVRNVALVQKVAQGGYKVKERTRRYRDPVDGKVVTETETDYAPPDWRAASWLLERSFAADFGRNRLEVTGDGGGPVQVEHGVVADVGQLADRLHAFALRRAAGELEAGVIDAEPADEHREAS